MYIYFWYYFRTWQRQVRAGENKVGAILCDEPRWFPRMTIAGTIGPEFH
jgi:hypothetical protein